MGRLLVVPAGQVRQRWVEAFPDGAMAAGLDEAGTGGWSSVWLDLSAIRPQRRGAFVSAVAAAADCPVIAMVGVPADAEASALLQAGARGYCHIEAAGRQLEEIALVVEHGGFWMPPALANRILSLSLAVAPAVPGASLPLETLTERERMVAGEVARGASNREIAESLDISERTVKAHLTTVFDKLDVRDRVQLALAMNNVKTD